MFRLTSRHAFLLVVATGVTLVLSMMAMLLFMLHRQVALQLRAATIESELRELQRQAATRATVESDRLTGMEERVFGAPATASTPAKVSVIELWQRNRDTELRRRLLVLERARLRDAARLAALERE